MPTGARNQTEPHAGRRPDLWVEWLVVGLVVVAIAGTTTAVLLFLKQGKVRKKPQPVPVAKAVAPPKAKPPIAPKPAPLAAPAPPDTSAEELAAVERDIKAAREAKAKADLMAWAAELLARQLKKQEQATLQLADQAAAAAAKLSRDKQAIEERASALADNVARLELAKDQAAAKLAVARSRKGYSIIPYRGPNGTWQRPLPIECANETAQIMPGGPSFRLIDLELSGMSRASLFSRIVELAIRKAASQATPDGNAPTVYVLFVVRPSGIKPYYEARARLQAQGVAFGYELVDEKTPIDYPDLGDLSEWPGFVPPQDLAENAADSAITNGSHKASGGTGLAGAASSGNGTGPGNGDGLYVWKNGLDGTRTPGSGGGGMADSPTSGLGNAASGQPGLEAGGGRSPRVDFGPGTLSQLARTRAGGDGTGRTGNLGGTGTLTGPGGTGLASAGNGRAGSGLPGTGDAAQGGTMGEGRLSLDPPYGRQADPRRAGGGNGTSAAGPDSQPGTFEGLMAELAQQQGGSATGRLESRPGAVPIMPGDLADATSPGDSPFSGGGVGGSPANRSQPDLNLNRGPGVSSGRSPFATNPPATLPRFEPAPASGEASGTGSDGSPAGQLGQNSANAAQGQPGQGQPSASSAGQPSSATAGKPSSGAGRPLPLGQPGSETSEENDKPEPDRGLRAGLRRMFGGDNNLPEKAWELVLFCDADGITIRPGEHRLKLADLQGDPDLLPRTLQSIHEKHARTNPDRYWRPYIRYRVANGGDSMMGLSQQQLAEGLVRWPAVWERVASSGGTGRNQ